MAVTCDGKPGGVECRRPAVTQLAMTMRSRTYTMDLCDPCSIDIETFVVSRGANVTGANVDYKPRAAYVAASGVSFTAEEARPWLIERSLASSRGRLSKAQLQAYADAH